VLVDGHHIVREYRAARCKIGLVPQELHTDMFETVWDTVNFSRGLFGFAPNPGYVEKVLRDLSLWEKRRDKIMALSGGMKRRVLIAIPSSSPRTTSTKPRKWPTGSASSTRAS
jgi:ABC-2 type transport system ATP-binding protein